MWWYSIITNNIFSYEYVNESYSTILLLSYYTLLYTIFISYYTSQHQKNLIPILCWEDILYSRLNPIKGDVSDSGLNSGGESFWPPSGNQWRSAMWPLIVERYFETYKIYNHMQKIRPISQKFTEILRFENFEVMRPLKLNFWATRVIFCI